MKVLRCDFKKYSQQLALMAKKEIVYKIITAIALIMRLVAVLFVGLAIYMIVDINKHGIDVSETIYFVLEPVTTMIILVIVSFVLKGFFTYQITQPYSAISHGYLTLNEGEMKYSYWKLNIFNAMLAKLRLYRYSDEKAFNYIISGENIEELKIDEKEICHIKGQGNLVFPRNRKMLHLNEMTFLVAFEDEFDKETILTWYYDHFYKQ